MVPVQHVTVPSWWWDSISAVRHAVREASCNRGMLNNCSIMLYRIQPLMLLSSYWFPSITWPVRHSPSLVGSKVKKGTRGFKDGKGYLKVQSWQRVTKVPRVATGPYWSKISKAYRMNQGIKRIPRGPGLLWGGGRETNRQTDTHTSIPWLAPGLEARPSENDIIMDFQF